MSTKGKCRGDYGENRRCTANRNKGKFVLLEASINSDFQLMVFVGQHKSKMYETRSYWQIINDKNKVI